MALVAMCRACAISAHLDGSSFPNPASSTGLRVSAIQLSRSITSLPFAPKAQHLAEPFVHVRIGAVAAVGVFHDPHRHGRTDDTAIGTDCCVVVTRCEINPACAASKLASSGDAAQPS